ncbi:MAG: N-formylglutamate amidohydrolase, partial [Brevundimonas sp.]|nr:N-formylglutamate amidohydrolase [Brevundimonas sp.]
MGSAMADGREQGGDGAGAAPFTLVAPATPGPFVFASPHSGDVYPADMGAAAGLDAASLRSAEDALVDRLIAPGQAGGAALLLA